MSDYSLASPCSWTDTIDDLDHMFDLWGVTTWTTTPPREPKHYPAPQTVTVSFTHPKRGPVEVSCDRWTARLNLRAIYLSLEDLRMIDKRGLLEVMGAALLQLTAPRAADVRTVDVVNGRPAYQVLGVRSDATPEEIRQAYHYQARQHHPDVDGEARRMAEINEAYDILKRATAGARGGR